MRTKIRGKYKKLVVGEEDNINVSGASGIGKDLVADRILFDLKTRGWTNIFLPSFKLNFEKFYACFKAEKPYHIKHLKMEGLKPQAMKCKNYHFYCNQFPRTSMPEFNIKTISIKDLDDRLFLYYLSENYGETGYLRLLIDSIKKLKSDEGLYDLIGKVDKSKKQKGFEVNASLGDKRQTSSIVQIFERYRFEPLFFPDNFEHNLNMKEIIYDQEHYHCFSAKYFTDIKTRMFLNLYILLSIIKVKQKYPNSPPVAVYLDEVSAYYSANPLYEFQKPLNKIVAETLRLCRGLGINLIGTCQAIHQIDAGVKGSFNTHILGRMSDLKDLSELAQIVRLNQYERQDILTLKQNRFFVLNLDGDLSSCFNTFFAPYAKSERGYSFIDMYRKQYPKKMRNHSQILDEIKGVHEKSKPAK
jgi:hypothetical protein